MTNDDLELRLARRLRERAPEPTWDFADRVMAATDNAAQRRRGVAGWLPGRVQAVSVPGPMERGSGSRSFVLLLAAALLVGLLAGAIAFGSGLVKLPVLLPQPSLVADASNEPAPSTSAVPTPTAPPGLVAYTILQPVEPVPDACTPPSRPWCSETRIWVANSDGTGSRELLPGVPGNQVLVAWMPDGTRLLYAEDRGLAITDLSGSEPQIVTPTQCPVGTVTNCPNLGGSLSPDGTRLAYTILQGSQGDSSVVAIFDLTTAQIRLLDATRTTGPNLSCDTAEHQGFNELPRWGPDGTRLVVTRQSMGPRDENGMCRSMVYTVRADGTDLRVVVPSDARHEPFDASWSPDGSHILFQGSTHAGGGDEGTCDIAIVRTDGTDLRQLTSDGISCTPRWTRDGRILFSRWVDPEAGTFDLWIMDPDGTNQTRLSERSLAALSAAGCVACPAPPGTNWSDVLWQPN